MRSARLQVYSISIKVDGNRDRKDTPFIHTLANALLLDAGEVVPEMYDVAAGPARYLLTTQDCAADRRLAYPKVDKHPFED